MDTIVLAAGRGKRMNSKIINKVLLPLAGRPMITYTIDLLEKAGFKKNIVVVGFRKEKVKEVLGRRVLYVEQKKRLGTAKAVEVVLREINPNSRDILILNGDDSAFYSLEVLKKLISLHQKKKADISMLTTIKENPAGLGRIIRTENGEILKIIEEKDAVGKQRDIREVNTACYIIKKEILRKYLPKIKKSSVSGEYYLTEVINLAVKDRRRVETLKIPSQFYLGVNTPVDYQKAQEAMQRRNI